MNVAWSERSVTHALSFAYFPRLYEDDFDEDEDLPETDILALKGLANDEGGKESKPWTMVTGIDDDIEDDDDDLDDDDDDGDDVYY